MAKSPKDIGIVAMDVYFPSTYVKQSDLEKHDGVSEGKYTIGLAQSGMAFCSEREDINSACLTAVHNLMEKYNLDYNDIGRVEVGTETIVDKSKAVKTTLMRLFQEHGNFDVEGIDTKNACYGGTAALLNSLAWVESSAWDGRYAIVLAGDIAVYEKGPARPTGGAGVVAMLIGPDAQIVVEPGLRASHMEDVYDFYKPDLESEYPRVDGHLSNSCYLRSLDSCYQRYSKKYEKVTGEQFSLDKADYMVFHAPYNKLVQKSFGRVLWNDYIMGQGNTDLSHLERFKLLTPEESYWDRDMQKELVVASKDVYQQKVEASELITKQCGNSYCGSLYAGLLSLVSNKADDLVGKRVLMFSYGSGLAATLFSLKIKSDVTSIRDTADVTKRLEARTAVPAVEFENTLAIREQNHARMNYEPITPVENLTKGTYFLSAVDDLNRRQYQRRSMHTLAASFRESNHVAPRVQRVVPIRPVAPRLMVPMTQAFRAVSAVFRR